MKNSTLEQKQLALSTLKRLMDHPDGHELTKLGMSANIRRWEAELDNQANG